MNAEALQRDRFGNAFAQRRRRAWVRSRELARESLQPLDRGAVVSEFPGRA